MTRYGRSEWVYAKRIEYAHIQDPTGNQYPPAARHFFRYPTQNIGEYPIFQVNLTIWSNRNIGIP